MSDLPVDPIDVTSILAQPREAARTIESLKSQLAAAREGWKREIAAHNATETDRNTACAELSRIRIVIDAYDGPALPARMRRMIDALRGPQKPQQETM